MISDRTIDAVLLLAAVCGLLCAAVLTPMMRSMALRVGYLDHPGAHKSHRQSTPYGGGVAIFLAAWAPAAGLVLLSVLVSPEWVAKQFGPTVQAYVGGLQDRSVPAAVILAGAAGLHLLGILDDLRPLGPYSKLLVMSVIAVGVAWLSGIRVADFAGPLPAIVLTALWILVVINSFNFLDNMDGLSAGVAACCLLMLAVCGRLAGQVLVPAFALLQLGAVLGFLCFNFPPARLFMGDAGSLLVGYTVAMTAVMTTYYSGGTGAPPYSLVMPLVVLAVPLYDFCTVIGIRIREGRNPLKGDQRHFSHRLVDHGLTRRSAVVTIYVCTIATGLAATLLPGADLRGTLTVCAIVVLVLCIIGILERPVSREP